MIIFVNRGVAIKSKVECQIVQTQVRWCHLTRNYTVCKGIFCGLKNLPCIDSRLAYRENEN